MTKANIAALSRGLTENGERCEIDRFGPVPVSTARALLDDAAVAVLVRHGEDITAVSSPKRTIPVKLRRALEAKYPTCGVKSCANDKFLEVDHVVPVEKHGETNILNTWRICSHHHDLKTYGGWRVVGEPGNRDLVPPYPGLRARRISVSPGQSQNKPLGERALRSARTSASNSSSRSPKRCGAEYDIER